jgi:anaerobic dimethyl sulfoxide reductase subunit A
MPGVVVLRHGAWIELDEKGVDHGGCPNMLLFDDKSPQTPAHATGLVQVEKVEE